MGEVDDGLLIMANGEFYQSMFQCFKVHYHYHYQFTISLHAELTSILPIGWEFQLSTQLNKFRPCCWTVFHAFLTAVLPTEVPEL